MQPLSSRTQSQTVAEQRLSTASDLEATGTKAHPTDISADIASAKATLADASDVRRAGAIASEKARNAIAEAKGATSSLAESIDSVEVVIAKTSSFDKQWEEFKAKFDQLNKLALQNLSGMMGITSAAKRPAEMISEERAAQVLRRASKVVVLTGAGISAESGIPTFRGADGFWTVGSENYRPQELATWEKFNEMPEELWHWYQYRWDICRKAKPNPGHYALVELEKLTQGDFMLVTQNIDGLHLEAGSDKQRVYEIHGRIDQMRCDERLEGACLHGLDLNDAANFDKVKASIVKMPPPAKKEEDERLPCCPLCGVRQRPKILWFDESYNESIYGSRSVQDATHACDVLLIIGTQLSTGLPSTMLRTAMANGTTIIKMDTIVELADEKSAGMLHIQAKSGQALPRIVSELRTLQKEPALAPLSDPLKHAAVSSKLPTLLAATDKRNKSSSTADLLALSKNSSPAKAKLMGGSTSVSSGSSGSIPSAARRKPSSPAIRASVLNSASATRMASSAARAEPCSSPSTPPLSQPRSHNSGALKAAGSASLVKGCHAVKSRGHVAEGFFVYGTLRPDDDSGAAWTKAFIEEMDSQVAFLAGASLYIDGSYPAVSLEQTSCSVRGAFMWPKSRGMLSSKLAEADSIEGFPDLYDRVVLPVQTATGETRQAYVYHRTGRTDRAHCTRVPDGDWLSRKRA